MTRPDGRGDMSESDGEPLARLGVDAEAWAAEFVRIFGPIQLNGEVDEGEPGDTLHAWFCNAIEAGRSAGYVEGVKAEEVDRLGF